MQSPQEASDLGRGYVLVCRSTDPAWTPLFVNAAALLMECGGALSHGAVVAREMGIPAVVLANATTLFSDGEILSIDGHRGAVARKDAADTTPPPAAEPSPDDDRVEPPMIPPPRGAGERLGSKLAIVFSILWGVYLLAALLLPEQMVYDPSMRVLDAALWPLVRSLGRPATVAIAAAAMAALTMIGQRLLTDNTRLREANGRAHRLQKQAAALPRGSRRRLALTSLAAPVQWRVFTAAIIPICLLLGPMIMTFLWFPARVDPASWNAPPGALINVVASIDSTVREPVILSVASPLSLDDLSPSERRLPPIRETLERLLAAWRVPSDLSAQPWEIQQAAELARQQKLPELEAYLRAGVPPQNVSWQVRSASGASGRFPITVRVGSAAPGHAKHGAG